MDVLKQCRTTNKDWFICLIIFESTQYCSSYMSGCRLFCTNKPSLLHPHCHQNGFISSHPIPIAAPATKIDIATKTDAQSVSPMCAQWRGVNGWNTCSIFCKGRREIETRNVLGSVPYKRLSWFVYLILLPYVKVFLITNTPCGAEQADIIALQRGSNLARAVFDWEPTLWYDCQDFRTRTVVWLQSKHTKKDGG